MSRDTVSILRQARVVITLTAVGWSGAALAAPAHATGRSLREQALPASAQPTLEASWRRSAFA